jgi:hypothetical protein
MTLRLRRLLSGSTDLAIAGLYIWVAATPGGWEGQLGQTLWRAAMMEFFAIHAAGFLLVPWLFQAGDRGKRIRLVLAISAAYTVVLGVASLIAGAWWPLLVFWGLTVNRAIDPLLRDRLSDQQLKGVAEPWAGSIVLFVGAAVAAGLVGDDAPVVLAVAGAYFLGVGISEVGGWWWVARFAGGREQGPPAAGPRRKRWWRKRMERS